MQVSNLCSCPQKILFVYEMLNLNYNSYDIYVQSHGIDSIHIIAIPRALRYEMRYALRYAVRYGQNSAFSSIVLLD